MSHVCYLYLYRGSCCIFVNCIYKGAHVAFVLFVFVGGSCRVCVICMLHVCYLYL